MHPVWSHRIKKAYLRVKVKLILFAASRSLLSENSSVFSQQVHGRGGYGAFPLPCAITVWIHAEGSCTIGANTDVAEEANNILG